MKERKGRKEERNEARFSPHPGQNRAEGSAEGQMQQAGWADLQVFGSEDFIQSWLFACFIRELKSLCRVPCFKHCILRVSISE